MKLRPVPHRLALLLLACALIVSALTGTAGAATPVTVSGTGTDVVDVTLPKGTLVATSSHQGESNFVAYLVGQGSRDILIANVIGVEHDEKVVDGLRGGAYRMSVDADGPWTLTFSFPPARGGQRLVPGSFSGDGAKVIRVKLAKAARAVVNASNDGDSNFIVYLYRLGRVGGSHLVVNEIGPWTGRDLAPQLAAGSYLLEIDADGPWSLRFQR